jgi:hypothetical protein
MDRSLRVDRASRKQQGKRGQPHFRKIGVFCKGLNAECLARFRSFDVLMAIPSQKGHTETTFASRER